MLAAQTVKTWYLVHKWTSLVCTVFLLMLCVTGLPLIFYTEIDHLISEDVQPAAVAPGTPTASLDAIADAARAAHPNDVIQYVVFDEDHPDTVYVTMAPTITSTTDYKSLAADAHTGKVLEPDTVKHGVMEFLLQLHTDMFAGLPGELFLGAMGALFVASLISGLVVYGPFMRRLDFGTVRKAKARRIRWLDLHNLLGVVALTWMLVVGATGVLNTLAIPILALWQNGQLAEMVAPYKDKPPAAKHVSLDTVLANGAKAASDMKPYFIAFPGTLYSSNHHFGVFMRGATPLTSRIYKPALIDAETGALTDMREMPWYAKALFVSQPLHFGDYGGLPLKIIWALLDMVTIVVLASGVYLWLGRRRSPLEARLTELIQGGAGAIL